MPRIPRRKRLTRRAGWWKDASKQAEQKSAQTSAQNTVTPVVNPVNEFPANDPPPINPYPMHEQVDHDTDNPANHEYLQNAEELIQHLKKQLRKPGENLHYSEQH